jgi:hypothetical protein
MPASWSLLDARLKREILHENYGVIGGENKSKIAKIELRTVVKLFKQNGAWYYVEGAGTAAFGKARTCNTQM